MVKLLEGVEKNKHHVYMDNLYTSPTLFKDLKASGFEACGTARTDRIGMPKNFKKPKMKKGDMMTKKLPGGVLALQWKDKRVVTMLSMMHDASMVQKQRRSRHAPGGIENVMKPTMIEEYNKHMGGVVKSDQLLSYYGFSHRTVKWWRRVFFHLLDMSVVNAYVLYRKTTNNKRITHENFHIKLASELLVKAGQQQQQLQTRHHFSLPPPSQLTERHFLEKIPLLQSGCPTQLNCHVCSAKKGRSRVTTTYQCKQCKVPLCVVPCNELYHIHVDPVRYLDSK